MIVVLSPVAERDLEEIGDYIARDSPRRDVDFIRGIRERCEAIAAAPRRAPLRDDISAGVRMVVHGHYLVFYRVTGAEIRVERILHGARDIRRLLAGG